MSGPPTAAELSGRSESNRVLLERLISNTANIIKDQKRWFSADGSVRASSPSPAAADSAALLHTSLRTANPSASATDAMRAAAFGSSVLDPQTRSMSPAHPSVSRRAPERAIISPHAATTSPLASAAAAAAARMSPVPAAWVSPPLSPELAPPGAAAGGGG
eukprot:Rhum_TRINITY_DN14297_c5_g1::Rhum_TRINITY_DN14297_c5_g1_i1::g.78679::m.78679